MRPSFLVLTPVSLFLGFCTALASGATISVDDALMVLLGALSAHICVNTFNEYLDFSSGLDAMTKRTPFSGGSGALVDDPGAVNGVLYLALTTLCVTILTGVYLVYRHGLSLLPIGLIGVLIILTYTPWLNRRPLLCLLAPGLAFGPLMVAGTHRVLSGDYAPVAIFVSLVPFFLVNNLLLLNQFPDVDADRQVGRRHFPIAYGLKNSTLVYGLFATAAGLVIVAGVFLGMLPRASYLALVPLLAALAAFGGAWRHAGNTAQLTPFLGMNVLATLTTPVVLGLTLISG